MNESIYEYIYKIISRSMKGSEIASESCIFKVVCSPAAAGSLLFLLLTMAVDMASSVMATVTTIIQGVAGCGELPAPTMSEGLAPPTEAGRSV